MKNLRNRFERFCFRNRDKGIPNLMLFIALGTALVCVMNLADESDTLYYILCFDRAKILRLFWVPLADLAVRFTVEGDVLTVVDVVRLSNDQLQRLHQTGTVEF